MAGYVQPVVQGCLDSQGCSGFPWSPDKDEEVTESERPGPWTPLPLLLASFLLASLPLLASSLLLA